MGGSVDAIFIVAAGVAWAMYGALDACTCSWVVVAVVALVLEDGTGAVASAEGGAGGCCSPAFPEAFIMSAALESANVGRGYDAENSVPSIRFCNRNLNVSNRNPGVATHQGTVTIEGTHGTRERCPWRGARLVARGPRREADASRSQLRASCHTAFCSSARTTCRSPRSRRCTPTGAGGSCGCHQFVSCTLRLTN